MVKPAGRRRVWGYRARQNKNASLVKGLDAYLDHFEHRPDEAKALLSVGDSEADSEIEATELAAYTALASVILNLDEFITRE